MAVYKQVFLLGLKKSYRYKVNFYVGLISFFFPLLIQYYLWTGLFKASGSSTVFGYTLYQMLFYAVAACLVTKVVSPGFAFAINEDIKNGGLAKFLVRPVSYYGYSMANYLGEKTGVVLCSSLLFVALCGVWSFGKLVPITMVQLLLFFFAVAGAIVLNFMIYYGISGLGFWMTDASGAVYITILMGKIISGGIFPLDIFGTGIQRALAMLPFPYTGYFPISILCYNPTAEEIAEGFVIQAVWIVVCFVLMKLVWSRGLKKYTAVGG